MALLLLLMPPLQALAQLPAAVTTRSVQLRAGPSPAQPSVAILPPGTEVAVEGCLRDGSWCQVQTSGFGGWVWARNLDHRGGRWLGHRDGSRFDRRDDPRHDPRYDRRSGRWQGDRSPAPLVLPPLPAQPPIDRP